MIISKFLLFFLSFRRFKCCIEFRIYIFLRLSMILESIDTIIAQLGNKQLKIDSKSSPWCFYE